MMRSTCFSADVETQSSSVSEMHSAEDTGTLSFPSSPTSVSKPLASLESLCSNCRYNEENYPTTAATRSKSNNINKDIRRSRQSAVDGCWMCAVLIAAIQLWGLSAEEEKETINFFIRYDAERFTIRSRKVMPNLQVYSVGEPQVLRFITDTELPATASSPITTNFIAYNLNQCLHTHSACQKYQARLASSLGGGWPMRVLRINSMDQKIQLIDFDPAMASRYTALSYCWGDTSKQFKATSETLPSLIAGVDVTCLPQTLRDAVSVTTSLGTNLIWIDSMCIVQDDINDWNREAGKMSAVYALALVTIIASSASACDKGFLDNKRRSSIHLADVKVAGQTTELRARLLHDWGHHRGGRHSSDNDRQMWVDPVDTRAWTLQERLLSARYITYTSGEVQWGCRTLNACECRQRLYGDLYKEARDPEDFWFDTVQEYLTRNLTNQTDKVTAIAGIGRMTASSFPSAQYVAGIWTTQLTMSQLAVRGLLWFRNPFSKIKLMPTTYTAPSFSWASIIGDVYHPGADTFENTTFTSRIVEVGRELESSDPFGRVSVAYLRLAGPVLRGKLISTPQFWTPYEVGVELETRGWHATGDFDARLTKVQLPDGGFTVKRSPWPADGETPKTDDHWSDEIDIRLLPLRVLKRNYLGTGFTYRAGCLILARSVQHPGYERIGVLNDVEWEDVAKHEPQEEEILIY